MATATTTKMGNLPALRRQHLLAEFAGLKQACPDGIFVSLTPGDPSLWSGVLFVRKGPYVTAILRFQISFPDTYPRLPPLVTFSTDMFHPLITPLTTYTYTTDIQDNGTVSATDDERLPPGGFSLRHGFPDWFGRGSRGRQASTQQQALSSAISSPPQRNAQTPPPGGASGGASSTLTTPDSKASAAASSPGSARSGQAPSYMRTSTRDVSTYEVLRYIRSTFDDEAVLDSVPLQAAGNPGAWHAWRARQRQLGKAFPHDGAGISAWHDGLSDDEGGKKAAAPSAEGPIGGPQWKQSSAMTGMAGGGNASTGMPVTRRPGEWNWEGVWEDRVQKGIAASLSEAVLYGGAGAADDVIRFLAMEEGDVDAVKDNLLRTLGNTA